VKAEIEKIDIKQYTTIILIHPVGKFIFEEILPIGINKEVYDSNVATFTNTSDSIQQFVSKKQEIVYCCFGSTSDKYNVPYWKSYSQSKKALKSILKNLTTRKNTRAVFINVSTVDTGNENKLRPNADKTYWLSTQSIVDRSIKAITKGKQKFQEINIHEPNPNFKPTYYKDHEEILRKWKREMKRSTNEE